MTHSFSVPWSAIQTIFQLESDDVYKPVMSEVGIRNLINYSYTLLNFAGSPTQDLFKDRDNLDGIKCATLSNNNAFAISIRHPEKDENGNIENWQTIVIGNNVDLGDHLPEGSRYIMQPVFVLSGQITEDGEDFLIRDMICQRPSTNPNDEKVNWSTPENLNEIKAMLIYGYRALTDLIQTNEPLDLEALETTLDPTQYELDEEFLYICGYGDNDDPKIQPDGTHYHWPTRLLN